MRVQGKKSMPAGLLFKDRSRGEVEVVAVNTLFQVQALLYNLCESLYF